jgi:hypothetical protein
MWLESGCQSSSSAYDFVTVNRLFVAQLFNNTFTNSFNFQERKEHEIQRKHEEAAQRKREILAKTRKASLVDADNMDSHRSNSYKKPPSR